MAHRPAKQRLERFRTARRPLRAGLVPLLSIGFSALLGCTYFSAVRRDLPAASIDEAEARFRSAITGEPAALESLLADDFFYLTAAGTMLDKRGLIDHLRSGATRIDQIVVEDGQHARRDGLVVTTGHSLVDVRLDGKTARVRSRHLHVWVEEAGGWRLLARQADMQKPPAD